MALKYEPNNCGPKAPIKYAKYAPKPTGAYNMMNDMAFSMTAMDDWRNCTKGFPFSPDKEAAKPINIENKIRASMFFLLKRSPKSETVKALTICCGTSIFCDS